MTEGKYTAALRVIDARRQKALITAKQHNEEIEKRIPQIAELKKNLTVENAKLSLMILRGEADAAKKTQEIAANAKDCKNMIKELLLSYGYPADYLEPAYHCPICRDTGYVEGERCGCLISLASSIATKRFMDSVTSQKFSFEDFSLEYYPDEQYLDKDKTVREYMGEIYNYCKKYADEFCINRKNNIYPKSILMIGQTGLGKTHLSLAIAAQAAGKSYNVIYGSCGELFRNLQEEYFGRTNSNENYSYDAVVNADLLIIDDLGSEFENNFGVSMLYNVMNARLNSCKPTIITTNLTVAELEKRYGQRIVSRLMTLFQCLKFAGKDIRLIRLMSEQN